MWLALQDSEIVIALTRCGHGFHFLEDGAGDEGGIVRVVVAVVFTPVRDADQSFALGSERAD